MFFFFVSVFLGVVPYCFCYVLMLAKKNISRRLFGAQTVEQKLKTTKFSMDTWFTGGDFASEAMCQIQTAVRRRILVICF